MRFFTSIGGGDMKRIRIGRRILHRDMFDLPYFIAEIGVNHEGDMEKAKQMIEEVSKAGGDAVKFQVYKAERLASRYSPAYWDLTKEPTRSQYELFKKYDKFWKKEYEELADYARAYKVDFIATPFDLESVDFLEPLVVAYKIASADITTKPLIKHVTKKGKPILLSTGASSISEIWRAIEWIKKEGNDKIVLLHCTLCYPTHYKNAQLGAIKYMREMFVDYIIGYSDHTLPEYFDKILITAWLLGAQVIEKHYTWNKKLPGNDHYHSIDYHDLKRIIETMKLIKESIGTFEKNIIPCERDARKYARRSIVAKRKIPKGKKIEIDDITWKRPGTGILPWMIDHVIGGEALRDIEEDEIIMFNDIKFKQ